MNEYQARRQAKIERYRRYAANARKRSDAAYEAQRRIADGIPMGQPILVGHHSEKRHRRDLERIDRGIRTSIEEDRRAAYWESRAAAMESDTSISYRDPEAADKIRARIMVLEAKQTRMKEINAGMRQVLRKNGLSSETVIAAFEQLGLIENERKDLLLSMQYDWKGMPLYADYALKNNGANIRRLKGRLDDLARVASGTDGWRYLSELRRDGACSRCGAALRKGQVALYQRSSGDLRCYEPCHGAE